MDFKSFYELFKDRASQQDIEFLKQTISEKLLAREIRQGEVVDYSYAESIEGWKKAFDYFEDKNMTWIYTDLSLNELKDDEWLAAFFISIELEGELLASSNLFFNTYRKENGTWRLFRTYIEAGVKNPEFIRVKEQ